MTDDEIEQRVNEPDDVPIPGLGDAPEPDDPEGDGYVCVPADLVAE